MNLSLVAPLGFSTNDRWLKRAGLDYWEGVPVSIIDNLEKYLEETELPFYFFSSKTIKKYTDLEISKDSILIFGSETSGLPEIYHKRWPEKFATIPMLPNSRCLNLATSAGIVIFEAWRQQQWL